MKDNRYFSVLFEDDNVIVVNKAAGILVIPDAHTQETQTLLGKLKKFTGQKIWVIHRIDRDTTGVLIFAKNAQTHKYISMQFEHRKIIKKYIALVNGIIEENEGMIDKNILVEARSVTINDCGASAQTKYKVLERFKNYTLVEVSPVTGRRHQIRIHFWYLGHPLAIDAEYASADPILLSALKKKYKPKAGAEKPLINRLTLHAAELTLNLPSGETKTFSAPLPEDFAITIKQLKKYNKGSSPTEGELYGN
jgi:23S rRNA pseudouridine955/2504/2580 synthase/23S rRNA pseudouridine1911/1915/1917 synthase